MDDDNHNSSGNSNNDDNNGNINSTNKSKGDGKNEGRKRNVLIAGATGYLGRHLVREFRRRNDTFEKVFALTRHRRRHDDDEHPGDDDDDDDDDARENKRKEDGVDTIWTDDDGVIWITAQVTDPFTLEGIMRDEDGRLGGPVHVVVSTVGITRQKEKGVTYRDVDYRANLNLLEEARRSPTVEQFVFIHVLHGDRLVTTGTAGPMAAAKQDFCDELLQIPMHPKRNDGKFIQNSRLQPVIICPSGFFSDMNDFLDMAAEGRVWLFGPRPRRRLNHGKEKNEENTETSQKQQPARQDQQQVRINPIHGADLAVVVADTIEEEQEKYAETEKEDNPELTTKRSAVIKNVGGPDIFTLHELAVLALQQSLMQPSASSTNDPLDHDDDDIKHPDAADKAGDAASDDSVMMADKITYLWDGWRRLLLWVLPWVTPRHISAPTQFFLTAMGMDMVGECHGTRRLEDHFHQVIQERRQNAEK